MNKDVDLINSLSELAKKNTIKNIIETGTHRGLGSTTMLGNAFKNSSALISINTIEIDYTNFSIAKKNLKLDYKIKDIQMIKNQMKLVVVLKNLPQELKGKTRFDYQLILADNMYLEMLLEKSE